LSAELFVRHGIRISHKTVAKLLRDHGYSMQAPNESVEGAQAATSWLWNASAAPSMYSKSPEEP
jgi:hypothetical protein